MTTPREQARAELEKAIEDAPCLRYQRLAKQCALGGCDRCRDPYRDCIAGLEKHPECVLAAVLDPSNRSEVLGAMGGVLLGHDMQCWTEDRGQMRGSAYVFPEDTERSEASDSANAEGGQG